MFKLPRDGETDYIKRLIGLPGDKIQMMNGRLYINGQIVEREPLPPYQDDRTFRRDRAKCRITSKTLPGGVKHEIIQLDGDDGHAVHRQHRRLRGAARAIISSWATIATIPSDSRVPPDKGGVGYVPFENLIGRAEMIFFSVDERARPGNSGVGRGRCAGTACSSRALRRALRWRRARRSAPCACHEKRRRPSSRRSRRGSATSSATATC